VVNRRRWIATVTIAESLGYLMPAFAGIWSARLGIEGAQQVLWMAVAGLGEGFALVLRDRTGRAA
jgi:hypothetical protein